VNLFMRKFTFRKATRDLWLLPSFSKNCSILSLFLDWLMCLTIDFSTVCWEYVVMCNPFVPTGRGLFMRENI
jgi:hypothetical protein